MKFSGGNSISNETARSPFSCGFLWVGIPSPATSLTQPKNTHKLKNGLFGKQVLKHCHKWFKLRAVNLSCRFLNKSQCTKNGQWNSHKKTTSFRHFTKHLIRSIPWPLSKGDRKLTHKNRLPHKTTLRLLPLATAKFTIECAMQPF